MNENLKNYNYGIIQMPYKNVNCSNDILLHFLHYFVSV